MAILFISGLHSYNGMSSSGGNAMYGIAESLCTLAQEDITFISYPIVPSFPTGPIWIGWNMEDFDMGCKIQTLPTLNLKILKSILWGIECRKLIRKWAAQHVGEVCKVIVYNTYHPPIGDIYSACKKVDAKLFAILYDLGVPPKRLGLNWLTMQGYYFSEKEAKKYVPLLDGRIVINELIGMHYAPEKDYILVDGAVNSQVVSHLFPLKEKVDNIFTFVLAGSLWENNGTRLVLDTMKQYSNPNIRVVFAGDGGDVPLIISAAEKDSRISYAGMLDMDSLFELYNRADVLLNTRLEENVDYHFPGKLFEYLATGRYVISTSVAHAERDYGEYMAILHAWSPKELMHLMEDVQRKGKEHLYLVGTKARQFMLENRTWEVQVQRILEYIESKS